MFNQSIIYILKFVINSLKILFLISLILISFSTLKSINISISHSSYSLDNYKDLLLNPTGQIISNSVELLPSGNTIEGYDRSQINQTNIKKIGVWNATQYMKGDIPSTLYHVQLDDTLWQISYARYGNGGQCKK